jgi:Zn-dependent peptidase ImmA (M78 family)
MKIPNRFKIKGKYVEVVYQHDFVEGEHLGKWDPNSNTIVIAANQSSKKTLEIFMHEFLHAVSEFYGIRISEKQIETMDYPLARIVELLCEKA